MRDANHPLFNHNFRHTNEHTQKHYFRKYKNYEQQVNQVSIHHNNPEFQSEGSEAQLYEVQLWLQTEILLAY